MRFFDGMNTAGGSVCPLCGTNKEGQILLVPIPGTEDAGIARALQFHRDCAYEIAATLMSAMNHERENKTYSM